jgi:uncharacterized protein
MVLDRDKIAPLCVQNHISRLRVFGSVARNEDTESSDVDLLAEFTKPKSLFDLVDIEDQFSEMLGRKVDLLTTGSLSPYLRDRILREAKVVYEQAR